MRSRGNMRSIVLFALSGTVMGLSHAQSLEIDFEDLEISGEEIQTELTSYYVPGAVSSVGENKTMDTLDSVVRALPGTYTNIDPTQGTVNVNIRGLSGFGRVNTMIDGVPQTFYGTSANSASKYHAEDGGYGPSSSFGAMIDPNFLVGIDVARGYADGAKGVNALAGYANLRTIGVDDVVFEGRRFGVLSKGHIGNNDMGHSGMVTFGVRQPVANGSVGAIIGYSTSRLRSNYKDGDGNYYSERDFVRRLDQSPRSWLSKIEIKPNEYHSLLLSGSEYRNGVGGREAERASYSLDYEFNPVSPWWNLRFLAATTRSTQSFDDDSLIWMLERGATENKSKYFELSNTSYFNSMNAEWALSYGASYLSNKYERNAVGVNQDNFDYTPFSPSGKQELKSVYLTTDVTKGIVNLNANVTYTDGKVKGFKPACGSASGTSYCFPTFAANMELKSKALNFSTMAALDLSDWFKPFVSFSRNTRVPNTQEVFFNNEGGGSMNPFLKPERATVWQLGFNTTKENLIFDGDFLGVKLVGYYSKIKDYIHSQSFYLLNSGSLVERITDDNILDINPGFHAQIYTNSRRPVRQRGLELSLHYDMGTFFSSLSYSLQRGKLPVDATSKTGVGFGTVAVTELPRYYANWTLGGRLLEEKLSFGATMRFTGQAKRMLPAASDIDDFDELEDLPSIPMVVDLFANYQVNKNILLKLSVKNATNRNYIDALNSLNSTVSQSGEDYNTTYSNAARGRTFLFGAEIRY